MRTARKSTLSRAIRRNPAEPISRDWSTREGSGTQTSDGSSGSDLPGLLGDLSDAIAVVTVVHRSLEAKEIANVGEEEVVLRYAISLLRTTYNRLDMESCRSPRQTRDSSK